MKPEKRMSPLHHLPGKMKIETAVTGTKGGAVTRHRAQCVDISREGLGFSTAYPLRERELVKISLPLNDFHVTVPVLAEVLWVMPFNSHYRVGVKYVI